MNKATINREQLERMTREELIVLVESLYQVIGQLQERITVLEAELAKLKKPPATSSNSSQPPSRDQKPDQGEKKSDKRVGAKPGHKRATRPLVEKPDRVIEAKVEKCANCHVDLSQVTSAQIIRHQITELPPVSPIVIETQTHEVECPNCHTLQRGVPPEGLEPLRLFGPRLEATLIYYKQEQHLSVERIVEVMRELHGVELSEGGVIAILRRGGEAAQPAAEQIAAQVAASKVIGSDETSVRVRALNYWHWVFRSAAGIAHIIDRTRGKEVVRKFMGDNRAECWVSDCYGSQLSAPAENRQLCLAHQLRDLERLIEQDPGLIWAVRMKALFQEAIHLRNRFQHEDQMTETGYYRRVTELENRLDDLLTEDQSETIARKLYARYVKHQDHLLYFLHHPEVPPTNNACEQALRPSVIHRKVTNGFRSEWAAKAYAALETVIDTAKLKGRKVFEVLVELMGTPVLPFLDTPDP
jgi:transposase